jgi:hypothetical protein
MLGPKLKNVPGCVVKKSNPAGTVAALAWLAAAKISSALDKNALEFIRHLHAFADKFFRRLHKRSQRRPHEFLHCRLHAALFGRADVALFPFTFCAQTIFGLAGQFNQSMALT